MKRKGRLYWCRGGAGGDKYENGDSGEVQKEYYDNNGESDMIKM